MSENENPPLTPEACEQIAVDQHQVNERFWNELNRLRVNILSSFHYRWGLADELTKPLPPRQPIRILGILKDYAVALFDCEHRHYPLDINIFIWRAILQDKIEHLVMENIAQIERGATSLRFHASPEAMREAVREALKSHISTFQDPIIFLTSADEAEEVKEAPDKADGLDTPRELIDSFCRRNSISLEKLGDRAGIDRRQVYKIRNGKAVQEFALDAVAQIIGVDKDRLRPRAK